MMRAARNRWLLVGLAVQSAAAIFAETAVLKSHRIDGRSYVMLGDLADYYQLGQRSPAGAGRMCFQTATASLNVEAGNREVQLDGVQHWLSVPVLSARGELWVAALDVLKTIDPVLRHGGPRSVQAGCTVLLDPGHGGRDEGTHRTRSREKDMTIDVAAQVAVDLTRVPGVRVLMTRTNDVTVALDQRVELCKSEHADLYVSIHFNSGGVADGIETYCVPPAGTPPTAHAPDEGERSSVAEEAAVPNNRFDEKNIWLAHCVQKSLVQATQANDRGVRRARFYVLRHASGPAILIEAGFLSNHGEETKILTPEYRAVLARAIAGGILQYLGKSPVEHKS